VGTRGKGEGGDRRKEKMLRLVKQFVLIDEWIIIKT